MKNRYYRFTTRKGPDISKKFVVQSEDKENAENIVKEAVLTSNETIMTIEDVTHRMGEKETLQKFVNKLHDVDRLICTGGKYITTIESK